LFVGRIIEREIAGASFTRECYNLAHQCALVVQGVNACRENGGHFDLSGCQLLQLPDAVFHLMRNTTLVTCNLSNNVLSKIPPKLCLNFSKLTELNLSGNRMSSLPQELVACAQLQQVDISANSFVTLPPVLLQLQTLTNIKANANFIADVDVEELESCCSLENLNLEENPLTEHTHQRINNIINIRIRVTARKTEEWEDLSI
jgi:Leucine-rich repeat (LRR) protein